MTYVELERMQTLINQLELSLHPEGGYFKEVYRSEEVIEHVALPKRFKGDRSFSTSIYFLLPGTSFSAFHRIHSDETWHFYEGCPVEIYVISPEGELKIHKLGNTNGAFMYQVTIPQGHWFAAKAIEKDSFSLCGCTVAPGFDFEDFEMAECKALAEEYPQHKEIIRNLTLSDCDD
jgi:predicted cupin superfamily sugar epimerase